MKLHMFVAQSGLCARRKAIELINAGEITINHWPETKPSYEVQKKDTIRYEKKVLTIKSSSYVALYKPAGYITTMDDDEGRLTVMHLLDKKFQNRVYPVGRLDCTTSGIILLTNDGDLANKLAHPKFEVKKVYQATLDRELTTADFERIKKGLFLKDGRIKVDDIVQSMDKHRVKITIHSGKNRIVRRIFESMRYTIKKLERINFAGITKKGLRPGEWRELGEKEIARFKK